MGFIADVFDCILVDPVSGETIATTTLQDAQIQAQVQENDVRGGKGNSLLATLHAQRDLTIQLTDVEFNYGMLAKQLGQDIVTGANIAYAMPKSFTVATGKITLDKPVTTVDSDKGLKIQNASGVDITGFTVTTSSVDFTAAIPTVADGDVVNVLTYKYDTDATTESINFDGAVFAKGMTCILETYEIGGDERITHKIQLVFPSAVMDGNFTFNTQSQKQAVTSQNTLKVLKPDGTTIVGRSMRIPYTES